MSVRAVGVALVLTIAAVSTNVSSQSSAQVIAYDYTAISEALNPSIAKVFTDSSSGSGFLVSDEGLIATNHHVVRNSRYLAVRFAGGGKFAANVVVLDPQHDVAILKVNSVVVRGLRPLRLLPEIEEGTIKPGVPVVAFGSPLSQTFLITQGIVSKVEEGALLGDFLIEPGNSGGPLVNLEGDVIGINTFRVGGIAGAVRIGVLRQILESPEVRRYDAPDPSAEPLPMLSEARYPTDILKAKILEPALDDDAYDLDGGRFTVRAITPVRLGRLQIGKDLLQAQNRADRRGDRMDDPNLGIIDGPFYEWYRNARPWWLDYAVTFEIEPEYGSTAGSMWATIATAATTGFVAGYTGTPQPMLIPRQNVEFKSEFLDFKIYRDKEIIEPILPGRRITKRFETYDMTFIDEAYSGWYVYPPEAFMEGEVFELEIYDATQPDEVHKHIRLRADSKLIRQIRCDFAGVDASLSTCPMAETATPRPSRKRRGPMAETATPRPSRKRRGPRRR